MFCRCHVLPHYLHTRTRHPVDYRSRSQSSPLTDGTILSTDANNILWPLVLPAAANGTSTKPPINRCLSRLNADLNCRGGLTCNRKHQVIELSSPICSPSLPGPTINPAPKSRARDSSVRERWGFLRFHTVY